MNEESEDPYRSDQTARWLQQIETHNLEVTHRPGKKHSNADALSKRTCRSCERQEQMNSHGDSEDEFSSDGPCLVYVSSAAVRKVKSLPMPESGFVLEGWQTDFIRQAQLEDKEISSLLVSKESLSQEKPGIMSPMVLEQ